MVIEDLLLNSLIKNEEYTRKVIAFLDIKYFSDNNYRILFDIVKKHFTTYNKTIPVSAIKIEIAKLQYEQEKIDELYDLVDEIDKVENVNDIKWMVDSTENWCKERALYNAIYDSIGIIDNKNSTLSKNAIPELLRQALSVSFDINIGHDYLDNLKERYDYYHNNEERIPFDITLLNTITRGGMPKKTLCIVMAPTGGGKSIFLCHHAAVCLKNNKNVLYVTLEMSQERIAERIDANLTNSTLDELKELPYVMYEKRFKRATSGFKSKLIIKEYPNGSASALTIRHLIDELKIKKNFIPDVVIVDYLNLCASTRLKNADNSYNTIKYIAEELRALAAEVNVQLFSATQVNRQGYNNSDIDLTNTAESMGLTFTSDFFFAIISTEEMDQLNQVLFKQLKNRLGDVTSNRKFIVGLDKNKMKFYDVNQSAMTNMHSIQKSEDPIEDSFNEDSKYKGTFQEKSDEKFRKNFKKWS